MIDSGDLNDKLEQVVESINRLTYIIQRRGMSNSSASHSDDNYYYMETGVNGKTNFLRNLGSFNNTDFVNLMDKIMKQLPEELEAATSLKEELQKQLNNTTLTTEERQNIQEKLIEAENNELELQIAQNNTLKEEFKRRQRIEEERLRKEYQNFTDEKKQLYKSEDNYVDYKKKRADFAGTTANRNDASRMIAESGFGNNVVGRYVQTVIERRQRFDNMGNFAEELKNGGDSKMATAMFGNGKAGGIATKALGGFGKALGGVSKLLGGPWMTAILFGIDAVKAFAKVVGAANAYITRLINLQSDLNEMSFQKTIDIGNLINERQVEAAKYIGDLNLKQIEVQSENLLQAVDILTKQFVKATEIAVGPLTKGINETAYDAANAYIDYRAEQQKFGLEREMRQGQLERFQQKRGIENRNILNISSRKEEEVEAKFNYNTLVKTMETALASHTDMMGQIADPLIKDTEVEKNAQKSITLPNGTRSTNGYDVIRNNNKILEQLKDVKVWRADKYLGMNQSEKYMGLLKNLAQPELFTAQSAEVQAQWGANLSNTFAGIQEQVGNKEVEIATQVAKKYIDANAEVQKTWLQLAQKTEQWLDKFDQVTNNLGISLGFTNRGQLDAFQNSMFEASKVGANFGKSFEDVVKLQETFVETTGRNRMFGEHDYGQLLGLGKYLGDDGLAANYASEMEIFNSGVADSVDMLDESLQDVNRMGLNGRKYTKTLVDNLKLAQKYNFKDGTQGLMRMAKWAENTRFNLASLSGMIDKVMEGGLEGVITQGAQFQVLGGSAAMNADPIAMMFEAYADPEAYAKRMQDMTRGYGQIDKKTGETKFSGNEMMMMQQIAKVQGRSLEEVENEVRARNKREVVAKQLNGNFNEEEQSFISNNATYNKKTEQFQVKVKRGNQYVDTDVSQLSKEDLENLMPEKHNERMEDYMATVIDYLAKMTGEENLQKTMMGQKLNEARKQSYEQRLQTAHDNFLKMFDTYVTNAKQGMELANEKFTDYIQMWQNNAEAQGPGLDQINAATSNIVNALDNTAEVIAQANERIKNSIEMGKFGSEGVTGGDENEWNMSVYNMGEKIPVWSWKQGVWQQQEDGILKSNNGSMFTQAANVTKINDGIVSGGNKPMVMPQVSNVTKINDGLVQSDPKDVAIFAKEGGVIGNFIAGVDNKLDSVLGGGSSLHMDTVKVEISGSLDLSSGGQSVNIINELQNNPTLLRSLSRMLSQQISYAVNGGRGNLDLSIGTV